MKFFASYRTFNRIGGGPFMRFLNNYLMADFPDFGSAITELHVDIHFGGPFDPRVNVSLRRSFDRFNAMLRTLPSRRFERNRQRLFVAFECQSLERTFVDRASLDPQIEALIASGEKLEGRIRPLDIFEANDAVLGEIIEALAACALKIKASDEYRFADMLDWMRQKRETLPRTAESYHAVARAGAAARLAREAAMNPWEKLGVDFRDFHPAARCLLDDPFFWSPHDEFAPHGNDAGGDLFVAFRKWRKRNPNDSSEEFFAKQKIALCIGSPPDEMDDATRKEYVDACLGMAFAHLKIDGACPDWARRLAVGAIDLDRRMIATLERPWEHRDKRLRSLDLMERALSGAHQQVQ